VAAVKRRLSARFLLQSAQRRYILRAAPKLGLVAYPPWDDYGRLLAEQTTYLEDDRTVRDKRATTAAAELSDLTISVDGLEDVLAGLELEGGRILEVGPKYGVHARWIDDRIRPA